MKRTDLLNVLKLASPALLSDSEVVLPVLKSFKFTKDHVIASNDVIAVCLAAGELQEAIVPGKKLVSFLSACKTTGVKLSSSTRGNLIVRCGSSKLSLSSMSEEDWPFEFPDIEQADSYEVDEKFFTAIEVCSAQSPDTGLGSWMGGIIFTIGNALRMYGVGRGRATISHCKVRGIKSDKLKKISVPSSFCKAAIPMSKEFGTTAALHVTEDNIILDWGEGENVLSAKLISAEPPDIIKTFRQTSNNESLQFIPIEDKLVEALKRAATIGEEGTCHVTLQDNGLSFKAKSNDGALLNDTVALGGDDGISNIDAKVAAELVAKQLDNCAEIAFGEDATVMKSESGEFVYVVANRE